MPIHNADNIKREYPSVEIKSGKWCIARPYSSKIAPFKNRIIASYLVLVGKCDAVEFTDQ